MLAQPLDFTYKRRKSAAIEMSNRHSFAWLVRKPYHVIGWQVAYFHLSGFQVISYSSYSAHGMRASEARCVTLSSGPLRSVL